MQQKIFRVEGGQFKNLCYLNYTDENAVLIDPAWNYALINNFITENKISLDAVLLTHHHPDHTNRAENFARNYNVPVFMSGEEIDYYNFKCLNLTRVNHLEELNFGAIKVNPILTAGHTAGSISFLIGNNFYTGDTFFVEGVGVCNLHGSDVNAMYDSVQFVKKYLSKEVLFWPGHSFGDQPGKNVEYLEKNNIYFQLDDREHFVSFRNRKKQPDPLNFT